MAGGAALSEAQNERARAWLLELIAQHDNNQGEVAKLLGVSHPTVSRMRSGAMGTSLRVVQRMARLLGRNAAEVLEPGLVQPLNVRVVVDDSRYPSSRTAQQAALIMGCERADIEAAVAKHGGDDDPGDVYWIVEFLRERDRRQRRERAASRDQ
ncbi:MAG: helix-turn-helix transcriptional regulator [Polyangiaceae bacterium]|nr:helix-turn-helix transcriptional regulator [Polyangiaceae bacterium]